MTLAADWRHHDAVLELWLQDDTTPWTCVGEFRTHLPVAEIAPECHAISVMLSEYETIEAALPELAGTNLEGPQIDAVRPWGWWWAGLQQAVENPYDLT